MSGLMVVRERKGNSGCRREIIKKERNITIKILRINHKLFRPESSI